MKNNEQLINSSLASLFAIEENIKVIRSEHLEIDIFSNITKQIILDSLKTLNRHLLSLSDVLTKEKYLDFQKTK